MPSIKNFLFAALVFTGTNLCFALRNPASATSITDLYYGPRFQEKEFLTGWSPIIHQYNATKTGNYGFTASTSDNFGGAYPTLVRGDFDGDGKTDTVVAVINGRVGDVCIFLGRDTLPSTAELAGAKKIKTGLSDGVESLWAGDLNGDGITDMVIGVPQGEGAIVIVWGGAYLKSLAADSIIPELNKTVIHNGGSWSQANSSENFGRSVAIGDFDGDGLLDLASGAWGFPMRGNTFGRVAIFYGRKTWPRSIEAESGADSVFKGEGVTHHLGVYLAAGDLDGDGYSDLVFTSAFYPGPGAGGERGKVYIYYGGSRKIGNFDLAANKDWERFSTIEDDRQGAGTCFVAIGDINGDKKKDLAIGINRYDEGRVSILKGPILRGKAMNWWEHPDFSYIDAKRDTRFISGKFGQTLVFADVNADGCDDLLVGAKGFSASLNGSRTGEGAALLYMGDPNFPHYLAAFDDAWHIFKGKESTTLSFGLGASMFRSNLGRAYVAIGDPDSSDIKSSLMIDDFDANAGADLLKNAYVLRRTHDSTWGYDMSGVASGWSFETHQPTKQSFELQNPSGVNAIKELKNKFELTSAWLPSIQDVSIQGSYSPVDGSTAQVSLDVRLWMRPNPAHLDAMTRAFKSILSKEVSPKVIRVYNAKRFTGGGSDENKYFGLSAFGGSIYAENNNNPGAPIYSQLSGPIDASKMGGGYAHIGFLVNSEKLEVLPKYRADGHQFYLRSLDIELYTLSAQRFNEIIAGQDIPYYLKVVNRSLADSWWRLLFESDYMTENNSRIPTASVAVEALDENDQVVASTINRGEIWSGPSGSPIISNIHSSAFGQINSLVLGYDSYTYTNFDGNLYLLSNLSMPAVDAAPQSTIRNGNGAYAGFDKLGSIPYAEGFPMILNLRGQMLRPFTINDGSNQNSMRLPVTPKMLSAIKKIRVRWANKPWVKRNSLFPTIVQQPKDILVSEGENINFYIGVAPGNFTFEWRKGGEETSGVPIPRDFWAPPTYWKPGKTIAKTAESKYLLKSAKLTDSGAYDVVVTGEDGLIYSNQFNVYVRSLPPSAPSITQYSTTDLTVGVGSSIRLEIIAAGSPYPSIQWQKNGVDVIGANEPVLNISRALLSDAGSYRVILSSASGRFVSKTITVTVLPILTPTITTQPSSSSVTAGSAASFSVAASGTAPLSYQWRKDGVAISGATSSTYSIGSTSTSDAGSYTVVVANSAGSATSNAATLTVTATAPRLYSLAVRTALAANQTLIVGFTMSGGSKNVLLRAVGPTLGTFGVPGTMADPKLDLYSGSSLVTSNDNWGGGSSLAATFQSAGAFAYASATSLDAALVASINGGRTAHVYGRTAGAVLVEGYDAGTGDAQRFTGLSARNRVGTGANILIAGFSLSGEGKRNLLIRAVGPTLGVFGVPGVLSDPKLEIYQGSTKIGENDNWSSTLSTTFTSVGAFGLNQGSKDAAITVSLPAGSYTVQVSGADGGVGEALVEIYKLP